MGGLGGVHSNGSGCRVGLELSPLLEGLRTAGDTVICVPDGTRSLDTPASLRALAQHIQGPAKVLVGLGLHRPMRHEELAPMRTACPWPILQHDPKAVVTLEPVMGIPCELHPEVVRAQTVIAVGCVELHQYAGFSGGHKAVSVGLAGVNTLSALHARSMVCDPRVSVGRIQGNPFRQAIDALGRRAGTSFALQGLHDGRWVVGPVEQAFSLAASLLQPWEPVHQSYDQALLRVPSIKAVNFYQASRAATYLALSPCPPLRPGARLLLEASCVEGMGYGLGEQAFASLLSSSTPPWQELLTGTVPSGAGVQRAFMLARSAQRYELLVVGCQSAEELRAHGIQATERPASDYLDAHTLIVNRPFERLPQRA